VKLHGLRYIGFTARDPAAWPRSMLRRRARPGHGGPAGFDVEVGFDGLIVDDAWCDREAAGGKPWGHRGSFAGISGESKEGAAS